MDPSSIHHLAKLCRIRCTPEEEAALSKDLKKILDYVESLNALPTEGVEPCHHVLEEMHNVMRPDEVGPVLDRKTFLDNAPEQTGGFIRTPPIFK